MSLLLPALLRHVRELFLFTRNEVTDFSLKKKKKKKKTYRLKLLISVLLLGLAFPR